MSRRILGTLFVIGMMMGQGAIISAAMAAPAAASTSTSASDIIPQNLVARVESYFDAFDTVQARFVQTAPDGAQRIGTFYMDRPGKLRFDYDPPSKDQVVADGVQLYYYDSELKQTSSAPIGRTLADFLLRKKVRLSDDVKVTDVKEGGGLTQISMVQRADEGAGTLTLGFSDQPWGLKKWRIVDAAGQITEVELFDIRQNINLPARLFVYKDPSRGYN